MKLIVGVTENWGIGHNNDLLHWVPADIQYFKENTMGKVIIMGYLTLLSLPNEKPLPGRVNVVICDDPSVKVPGALMARSLGDLEALTRFADSDDLYIIGGASIYEQLLPYCSQALVTKFVSAEVPPADKFFPNLDELDTWTCTSSSEMKRYEEVDYCYTIYENAK
ncbi:MAG: dihydrofolate reductase, partial [Coriobacteriia bacterium]|nr:dihydrofolate reductase [Coriobacteriia bacterium]